MGESIRGLGVARGVEYQVSTGLATLMAWASVTLHRWYNRHPATFYVFLLGVVPVIGSLGIGWVVRWFTGYQIGPLRVWCWLREVV